VRAFAPSSTAVLLLTECTAEVGLASHTHHQVRPPQVPQSLPLAHGCRDALGTKNKHRLHDPRSLGVRYVLLVMHHFQLLFSRSPSALLKQTQRCPTSTNSSPIALPFFASLERGAQMP
jgi:hypothetical protein